MHEHCAVCGLRYEREQGYFVGAIYLNYAVTIGVCFAAVLILDRVADVTLATELAVAVPLALLTPLAFFRHARSLWLGIGHFVTMADAASERRARRRR